MTKLSQVTSLVVGMPSHHTSHRDLSHQQRDITGILMVPSFLDQMNVIFCSNKIERHLRPTRSAWPCLENVNPTNSAQLFYSSFINI